MSFGIFTPLLDNAEIADPLKKKRFGTRNGALAGTSTISFNKAAKGKTKIGSTLKGIGPTYMDKTGRNGLRVGDSENANFIEKYEALKQKHLSILEQFDYDTSKLPELEKGFFEVVSGVFVRSSYRAEQVLAKNNVGL